MSTQEKYDLFMSNWEDAKLKLEGEIFFLNLVTEMDERKRVDIKLGLYVAELLGFDKRVEFYGKNFGMEGEQGIVKVSKDYHNLRTVGFDLKKYSNYFNFSYSKQATIEKIDSNMKMYTHNIEFYEKNFHTILDTIERRDKEKARFDALDYRIRAYLNQ